MNKTQLSIFDMPIVEEERSSYIPPRKAAAAVFMSKVADVRSSGQANREVAFDVGEKIGGARKDLAKSRAEFLEKPSLNLLNEIENADVTAAAEVIIRDTFFSGFSYEDCKERGVEPGVAKAIRLYINRIPKESKDTKNDRKLYANTLIMISELLITVRTIDEFHLFEKVTATMFSRFSEKSINMKENEIIALKERLSGETDLTKLRCVERIKSLELHLAQLMNNDISCTLFRLGDYKGSLSNYYRNHSSRVSMLRNALAVEDWEELLPSTKAKKAKGQKTKSQPVWERMLPAAPTRRAGSLIQVMDPKQYVEKFGFRASEFGHYVGDDKGLEHIQSSAEAYTDLTELLQIPTQSVSLGGELAMAFGSRGRGRALGHYEPARKVINLTKKNGSLGILAHEWFHSLDHFLFSKSYNFENGKVGFLTDLSHGANLPEEVIVAVNELIEGIKVGESIAHVDVRNCTNRYTVNSTFIRRYADAGGDLDICLRNSIIDFDEYNDRWLSMYTHRGSYIEAKKKSERKRARHIRTTAEALAQHHFKETGISVDFIKYPVYHSCFYQSAIELDKGSEGKYWSSNTELAARAFEFYIHGKLMDNNWISDYLVCGTDGRAYPEEDCERERIFDAMDDFFDTIRPFLSELHSK